MNTMEYRIGDFSQVTRLTVKTLRYYHEIGLLEPCRIEASGYRWYDEAAVRRAGLIQKLKGLEFTLEEIQRILRESQDDADLVAVVRRHLAEVEGRLARDRAIRNQLTVLLNSETGEETMKTTDETVSWTTLAETRVASLAFRGRYDEIGPRYAQLFKLYGRFVSGPPLALYLDPEYREADASVEACVPLRAGAPAAGKEGVEIKVLPGMKVAQVIHRGPYDTLGDSYKKVFDFLAAQGAQAVTPSREVYLKGPGFILPRSPKKFVTVIQIPVMG